MSTKRLSDMLYWCVMLKVKISSHSTLARGFTRKQNAYNTAFFMLGFTDTGSMVDFEKETGFKLMLPPNVRLNNE